MGPKQLGTLFLWSAPALLAGGLALLFGVAGDEARIAGVVLALGGLIDGITGVVLRGWGASMERHVADQRELFEIGRRAVATVTEVRRLGLKAGKSQQVEISLTVDDGYDEFNHVWRGLVPFHTMPRPGDLIEVAYGGDDRSRLALATDWSASSGSGQALILRSGPES